MLTKDQKKSRLEISKYLYEDDPEVFMHRAVTQDGTWVHHFDPEISGLLPPKKFKRRWKQGR